MADTTTIPPACVDDDALEDAFFTEAAADEPPLPIASDPVLERKRSPEVAARRARLSWAVRGVVLAAAVLCIVAAMTRLAPGDAQVTQAMGVPAPAR